MIYKCKKCGYNTKHKSHFNSHINKIYPCSNEVILFSKENWDNTISISNKKESDFNSIDELNNLSKAELINIIKSML